MRARRFSARRMQGVVRPGKGRSRGLPNHPINWVDACGLRSILVTSGEHGSKYRVEVIVPGRQDEFLVNRNPDFRSADLVCATAHFHFSRRLAPPNELPLRRGLLLAV